jgi:hypothetical protein
MSIKVLLIWNESDGRGDHLDKVCCCGGHLTSPINKAFELCKIDPF